MSRPDLITTGHATLSGHGELDWAAIRALADGLTCSWSDYNGWQVGVCPDTAPPYTHLWGWSAQLLLRVRIDSGHGIAATLGPAPSGQPSSTTHITPAATALDVVPVRVLPALVEARFAGLLPEQLRMVRVVKARPLTFVVAGPAAAHWPHDAIRHTAQASTVKAGR